MDDMCFCHFNGYAVKDANARNRLTTIENKVTTLETKQTDLTNKDSELEQSISNLSYGLTNYNQRINEELTNIKDQVNTNKSNIGTTSNLNTESRNLVDAINEVKEVVDGISTETFEGRVSTLETSVGDINTLETTDKTNLVNALNETRKRHIIEGTITADIRVPNGETSYPISITEKLKADGTKFSYSEGIEFGANAEGTIGIKVPAGFTSALISANMGIKNNYTNGSAFNLYIRRNEENIVYGRTKCDADGGASTIAIPEFLQEVTEGDVLTLRVYKPVGSATADVISENHRTYLKVEFLR